MAGSTAQKLGFLIGVLVFVPFGLFLFGPALVGHGSFAAEMHGISNRIDQVGAAGLAVVEVMQHPGRAGLTGMALMAVGVGVVVIGLLGVGLWWWGKAEGKERRSYWGRNQLLRIRRLLFRLHELVRAVPCWIHHSRAAVPGPAASDTTATTATGQPAANGGTASESAGDATPDGGSTTTASDSPTTVTEDAIRLRESDTQSGPPTPTPDPTQGGEADTVAPGHEPTYLDVEGPPMKELEGSVGDAFEQVRPGDKLYARLSLDATNPQRLADMFANQASRSRSAFTPRLGGGAIPTLFRETALPNAFQTAAILQKLPLIGGTGHDMTEVLYAYWTDQDGDDHLDLLIHDTRGPRALKLAVLQEGYQGLSWDWVSTSELRLLVADGTRTPFPNPAVDGDGPNEQTDDDDDDNDADERPVPGYARDAPAAETQTIPVTDAGDLNHLLHLQQQAGHPIVARHLRNEGRRPNDYHTYQRPAPNTSDDQDPMGSDLAPGELMARLGNRVAHADIKSPVMLSARETYYCYHEKPREQFVDAVKSGKGTHEQAKQRKFHEQSEGGEDIAKSHGIEDERTEEEGRYGTRGEEANMKGSKLHLCGLTVIDGGCGFTLAELAAHSSSNELPSDAERNRWIGADVVSQAAASVLKSDFYGVTEYTSLGDSLARRLRWSDRLDTATWRLPSPDFPPLMTRRVLADVQRGRIRFPRVVGYRWNPFTIWPSSVLNARELATVFWPTDPSADLLTDDARDLFRWKTSWSGDRAESKGDSEEPSAGDAASSESTGGGAATRSEDTSPAEAGSDSSAESDNGEWDEIE